MQGFDAARAFAKKQASKQDGALLGGYLEFFFSFFELFLLQMMKDFL
jgi:hypothetical protein